MPSVGNRSFSISLSLPGPLAVLPPRKLRVSFPLPSPLLRALAPGELPEDGLLVGLAGRVGLDVGGLARRLRSGNSPARRLVAP